MIRTIADNPLPALLLLVGLYVSWLGVQEATQAMRLRTEGAKAVATVAEIEIVSPSKSSGKAEEYLPQYLPIVRWTTATGQTITARAGFSSLDPKAFKIGQTFTVYYDRKHPESAYFIDYPGHPGIANFMRYATLIIGGVFVIGPGLLLWSGQRKPAGNG